MSSAGDRQLAMVLGIVGALLIVLEGLVDLVRGVVFVAFGHGYLGVSFVGQSVLFIVVGLLIGFFALIGRTRGGERSLAAGVILVVLAIVGWLALGFASGVLALLGSVFVLVSGILYLVEGR
jgi:hypothetical protein